MTVAVINYGMGNIRSVVNAFDALGCPVTIADHPSVLPSVEHIVLPGVGAFYDGMVRLRQGGWIEALTEEVMHKKKPFLGICLGMQLLATTGTEHGDHDGLNWVPGSVVKIRSYDDHGLRVPHIGWNDVYFAKKSRLYTQMETMGTFYFVHSYAFQPSEKSVINGVCSYGQIFAASIEIENIFATQYHPEKSQKSGLHVLQNFVGIKG